jgi:hypothetical protein
MSESERSVRCLGLLSAHMLHYLMGEGDLDPYE